MDGINQTPQTQQTVNPTPSVNSSNSKLIPIILGVAVVAIIGIGAYLLGTKQTQPTAQNPLQTTPIPSPVATVDETANWKEYANEQHKFSIKYPLEMNLSEENNRTSLTIKGGTQGQGQELHDGLFITIAGLNNKGSLSFDNFVASNGQLAMAKVSGTSVKIETNESFDLNGIQGKKITGSELGSDFIEVFLPNNQQVIQIKANHGGDKDMDYIETFDQILATFQFTQ